MVFSRGGYKKLMYFSVPSPIHFFAKQYLLKVFHVLARVNLEFSKNKIVIHVKYQIQAQALNCKHVQFSSLVNGRGYTFKKCFINAYLFQKAIANISHQSEWPSKPNQQTTSGEVVEKKEPWCTVGGNADWCSHCGKQYGVPSNN